MATRKKRPSSPQPAGPPGSATAAEAIAPPQAERRPRLKIAATVFAIWFVLLMALALRTANPVTINRQQVAGADIVAEVALENVATGECRVIRTWPEADIGETISVQGLADLSAVAGESYLIPLLRTERGASFNVAPTHLPGSPRLIYPANDASRIQLEDAMQQR